MIEKKELSKTSHKTLSAKTDKLPKKTKKSFWKKYLDKLQKATGGKPPSCCG